jgi:hypothetical protein
MKLLNFANSPIFDIPCIFMHDALDEPSELTNALSLTLGIAQSHMTRIKKKKKKKKKIKKKKEKKRRKKERKKDVV